MKFTEDTIPFIFCAGRGTRLRPYTLETPKPLLPLPGNTFQLYEVCKNLHEAGFTRAIVNYSYAEDKFKEASDRILKELNVSITLSYEKEPLGPAGGMKSAEVLIDVPKILGINGDTITNIPTNMLSQMYDLCSERFGLVFVGKKTEGANVIGVNNKNEVVKFREKKLMPGEAVDWWDFAGIYYVKLSKLRLVPENEFFGLWGEDDLVERLYKNNSIVRMVSIPESQKWITIDTTEKYEEILKLNKLV